MQTVKGSGGARIPALGLGTWRLDGAAGQAAIEQALAFGYRHVDTAQAFGNEREVGAALAASGVARHEIFVSTKVERSAMAPDDLLASAERSAQRLGGPPDALLLHWPNPEVPLEKTLAALRECRERGLARSLGVSNFPLRLLERALRLAPIACCQVEYHPFLSQTPILDFCRANHVVLVAHSPLARGTVLTDRELMAMSRRLGRTVPQIVLRWLTQQHGVAVVAKAAHPRHQAENLALDFVLDQLDMASISSLSRMVRRRVVDPPFRGGLA